MYHKHTSDYYVQRCYVYKHRAADWLAVVEQHRQRICMAEVQYFALPNGRARRKLTKQLDSLRYDTIRDAIFTCTRKPT